MRDLSHSEREQGWGNPGHLPVPQAVTALPYPCVAGLLPCPPGAGRCTRAWLRAPLLYLQTIVYGFNALDLLGNLHGPLRLCRAGDNAG